METSDLTIHVLREIRDKIDGTNQRLDRTNERLERVEMRVDNLTTRMIENDARVATELVEVAGTNRQILGLLRDRFDLRDRVERCEHDIAELKRKVDPR